ESLNEIITDDRYGFVGSLTSTSVSYSKVSKKPTLTEKADNILLHKWLGIPLFALIMFLIFSLAFTVGDWAARFLGSLINLGCEALRPSIGNEFLQGLVCDGIIGGVGAVIVFIPTIALMFIMISMLEDSGYMSRAAFLSDRAMHAMGLHGKSFISMLLGFGCNVPGVMAARILESKADRTVTVMLNPLMSCSARLPVYVFFTSVFFEAKARPFIIMSIYLAGIILAVIMGKFFRSKLFDTKESPFVMEMPSYRMPTFRGTMIHAWERTQEFLVRAGSIITLVCVGIWVLSVFPNEENSFIFMLGHFLEPIMKPIGLDWMAAVSCLFGVGAKEIIVSSLNIICGVNGNPADVLREVYTPLQSYIFMIFTLIYCPCAATIVTMKKEIGEAKYFIISVIYPIVLAWVICFLIWQISRLFM
ncbi:MAG: ferrous iron transport protein B, partial [Armatimonadetes bacterium]|nr:ferrous iron transport protein B [Candidatus Hippobium faecium]